MASTTVSVRINPAIIHWVAAALAAALLLFPVQLAYAVSVNLPQPDHVGVVVFENHSFKQIINRIDSGRGR